MRTALCALVIAIALTCCSASGHSVAAKCNGLTLNSSTNLYLTPTTACAFDCDYEYCTCLGGSLSVTSNVTAACTYTDDKPECSTVTSCLTARMKCYANVADQIADIDASTSAPETPAPNTTETPSPAATTPPTTACVSWAKNLRMNLLVVVSGVQFNTSKVYKSCAGFVCSDRLMMESRASCEWEDSICYEPVARTAEPGIVAEMKISGNGWGAMLGNPTQYAAIVKALQLDFGRALGLASDLIEAGNLRSGSLIATMKVYAKATAALQAAVKATATNPNFLKSVTGVYRAAGNTDAVGLASLGVVTGTTAAEASTNCEAGCIAGSILGFIVLVAVLVFIGFLIKKQRKNAYSKAPGDDNAQPV